MNLRSLHSWNLTPRQAIALQKELAKIIDVECPLKKCPEPTRQAHLEVNRLRLRDHFPQ